MELENKGAVGGVDKRAPIRVGFYDIEKTIGKGNFAVVKLARHRLTKTEVAIKIIDKTQLSAADLRRAYREVRVLKKLHHPHIIRLYQVMETKNMLYIVTEYAPQGEIFEHIAKHGRLQEAHARRLYWQVVSAVDYCHKRGVVHRDLKAENLLLDSEGSVKLADFGFSTWWSSENVLSTWCGSPPYAAPEVFEGRQYTGPEVDIWSLGVVLYVLVCGALPFDASTLPALRERVLSARYRVPYFMSAECESLVRKMLVKDPTKRYTIEQVKRHRWMQADGPPRLLPAPGGYPAVAAAAVGAGPPKHTYLDPGLVPDPPTEPNEQVLRLMASLGIDSSRTRESLRQQSYDHHAAIYFLLLERLRQHRPRPTGAHQGHQAVRMMSTDSATCKRAPRRPSTVAEHAMRKMEQQQAVPAPNMANPVAPEPVSVYNPATGGWTKRPHVGPSQTSSVDEGVADMDSQWDESMSMSSGIAPAVPSSSTSIRSRADWKWPARGSSGSSVQISSDFSQASGSPRESVSGSGTTLSSWDSAWEQGGGNLAAASLPSCQPTLPPEPESPLSPTGPCLTTDRLWPVPPAMVHHPGSPTEFRLGRRASDGLVGGRKLTFGGKLEQSRAGGVAALAGQAEELEGAAAEDLAAVGESPIPDINLLCHSPAKRPSLPDSWKLPDWAEPPGTSGQLHRQLMALRLQRRTGVVDAPDLSEIPAARKSVLRQQSYKLAQQSPVDATGPLVSTGAFSTGDELHAHQEEEEDEEEEEVTALPWNRPQSEWLTLPTTMADCKLTDSDSSLRLSPLLTHMRSSSATPPTRWVGDSAHLLQPSTQETMDME